MQGYFVYILTNKRNGTIYTGVTNDLARRVYEHKSGVVRGFTQKHGLKTLVYFENFLTPQEAIHREKCLKRWKRDWKMELIEGMNPSWSDLYESILR
jgi:putative endonuclease